MPHLAGLAVTLEPPFLDPVGLVGFCGRDRVPPNPPGRRSWCRALVFTRLSVCLLSRFELDEACVANGVQSRECHEHGQRGQEVTASFREIEGRHRFVLSLPQMITMELLEAEVARHPSVKVLRGAEVTAKKQDEHGVTLKVNGQSLRAAYAVACDCLLYSIDTAADPSRCYLR